MHSDQRMTEDDRQLVQTALPALNWTLTPDDTDPDCVVLALVLVAGILDVRLSKFIDAQTVEYRCYTTNTQSEGCEGYDFQTQAVGLELQPVALEGVARLLDHHRSIVTALTGTAPPPLPLDDPGTQHAASVLYQTRQTINQLAGDR